MSTYFDYEHTASSAYAYNYDSHVYSADFYAENNMTHYPTNESALREPVTHNEDDDHCVFTTGLIHLLPKFHGFVAECPHRHLEEFHIIYSSMKPPHVPNDHIFLTAFPHSIQGATWDWLYYLPPRSKASWEDLKHLFLDKFSPTQHHFDSYSNNPGWNDPNLGWYDALQQY
ncbi:hypothetical protein VIGAN_06091700 [Vigna angularis var. angularis]|uniref:Retrotransposon gag domain-containing protein n=1 Tax=Vigna angularis var. angularis TaxID=157739 RepID=A0A0S3SAE9_PHAAN|nr:hypothetical protein VIGAN_06091700 [Vigna angularis var. angularis]